MSKHPVAVRSRYMLRLAICSTLALAVILLTACSVSPTHSVTAPTATGARATVTATPLPLPTSVIVLRFSGYPEQNRVAPFKMTSQDVAKVMRLYQAARALPLNQFNPGCPQDVDIGYELSFMYGNAIVLQVMLRGGCPVAELSGVHGCREWTPDFTAQIAATLGIPVTTLEPPNGLVNTADSTGPFAQGLPTPPILVAGVCL